MAESKARGAHARRLAKGGGASAESARRSLISGESPSTLAVADKGRPSKLERKARAAAHASSPDQRRTQDEVQIGAGSARCARPAAGEEADKDAASALCSRVP